MHLKYYQPAKWFLLLLAGFFPIIPFFAQGLSLKPSGDDTNGYYVDIYKGNQLIVTRQGDHFSDRSGTRILFSIYPWLVLECFYASG